VKPPIVIDDSGDLMVFDSPDLAQRYIEPIDIKAGHYMIYDSEGRLLAADIVPKAFVLERVVLRDAEDIPTHQHVLMGRLKSFLVAVGEDPQRLENCALGDLVHQCLPYKTE
jgi:hypothetical protein